MVNKICRRFLTDIKKLNQLLFPSEILHCGTPKRFPEDLEDFLKISFSTTKKHEKNHLN